MPLSDDRLDSRLTALDRDQLEVLVRRLLNREPSLGDLVHLPLPGEVQRADGRHIANQVTRILHSMGNDWRASTRAETALWPLVEIGLQYASRGELADARTVFVSISTTILAHYEQIYDEQSEVAGIVGQCVEGLGRCLAATTEAPAREALLRDVFAVYRWDALDHGGYGMDEVPRRVLVGLMSPTERALVAGWVQAALTAPTTAPTVQNCRWRRQRAGRLVLELMGSDLDSVDRERLFAEAALDGPRLELLLAQGRQEESVRMVRIAADGVLLGLADRLVAAGLGDEARAAVRDHPAVLGPRNDRVRDWLIGQGVVLPANLEALLEAIRQFGVRTTIGTYNDLRREAVAAGRWPGVLKVVGPLDNHKKTLQPVRARLLADLGDAAGALAELEGLTGSTWKSAAKAVAKALEVAHPAVAANLMRRLIDVLRAHGTKVARAQAEELGERLACLEPHPA